MGNEISAPSEGETREPEEMVVTSAPPPHALKAVVPFLIHSGYLTLCGYVHVHTTLRLPWRLEDALNHSSPPPFGERRFRLWRCLLQFDPDAGSSRKKRSSVYNTHDVTMSAAVSVRPGETTMCYYLRLAEMDTDATCLSAGQVGEIVRDVVRTFPGHPFFRSGMPGERMLGRILQAVAAAYPGIGYCQGMNFVVGTMLLGRLPIAHTGGLPNSAATAGASALLPISDEARVTAECDCFSLMLSLMHKGSKLAMFGLWQAGVPKMKLRVYQLDRLLRWTLPKLHTHFNEIQLAPEILVAQWFITIYSYTVPIALTMRLWDYIFLGGWPAMYRIALALMSALEPQLLELDLEGIGLMMRDWKKSSGSKVQAKLAQDFGPEKILHMASSMSASSEVLQRLQENFALEMIAMCESCAASTAAAAAAAAASTATSDAANFFFSSSSSFSGSGSATDDLVAAAMSGFQSGVAAMAAGLSMSPMGGVGGGKRRSENESESGNVVSLGPDHSQWLSRYGEELSEDMVRDVLNVRDELRALELQTENDKQSIQARILRACESCRAAEGEVRDAKEQSEKCQVHRQTLLSLLANVTQTAAGIRDDLEAVQGDWAVVPRPSGWDGDSKLESPAEMVMSSEDLVDPDDEDSCSSKSAEEDQEQDKGTGQSQTPKMPQPKRNTELLRRRLRLGDCSGEGEGEGGGGGGGGDGCQNSSSRKKSITAWVSGLTRTRDDTPSPLPLLDPSPSLLTSEPGDLHGSKLPLPSTTRDGAIELVDFLPVVPLQVLSSLPQEDADPRRMRPRGGGGGGGTRPSQIGAALKAIGSRLNKSIGKAFRGRRKMGSPGGVLAELEIEVDDTTWRTSGGASPPSLQVIEQQSQLCQRRLIAIHRKLAHASQALDAANCKIISATVELDEAKEHKRSLCDQLQRVVEESNRLRSSRLAEVAEKHSQ